MKKLLMCLVLIASSLSAEAATQCWVRAGKVTFDIRQVSVMIVGRRGIDDHDHAVYLFMYSTAPSTVIDVRSEAEGYAVVEKLKQLAAACK